MLFTTQEIQAILALLNRTPMTAPEQLFAQGFFQKLAAFCQPPKKEEDALTQVNDLADAVTPK